ncbi:YcdB/YcdC domain-containing protein [Paenibacillus agri]|uniref:S-layer homology domain-containing protein n=1 Tax=Paenibacillus agri TaxID=2744309 RepID=A0A850EHL7_9BACL|nr:S-layer homology domain-containing protein [Paenibacillus agri]NUU60368.1 S-layer homology domain-containing protein [Paenibacillus agri]
MKSNNTTFIQQKTRTALVATVALSLLLPAGLAGAASSGTVSSSTVNVSASAVSDSAANTEVVTADPSKVKFSKEAAIAKVKELFPILKDATVNSTELGSTNSYPPRPNQMIWNTQWQYQDGNSGYGFNSEVDALNGDLINIHLYFFNQNNESYYPPKVTEAQALEKARAFIAKAAASIKSSDLKLQESPLYDYGNALFGPVRYNFTFNLLKNGLPSSGDYLSITVDGNGEVVGFNKSSDNLAYPSAVPKVTQAQAEKSLRDSFDVGLYYNPIYKNGVPDSWILSWSPVEQALYAVDAATGKRLTEEGITASSSPVTYTAVPQAKEVFKSQGSAELTAEQAAKLVEKVGYIPAGRKLTNKWLNDSYPSPGHKVWRLTWDEGQRGFGPGFPSQSSAEIDAVSGEIISFQTEQYNFSEDGKPKTPAAPAGAKKLTATEAAQKATALINALYPQASSVLKQVEYGSEWSTLPDGTGYRYQYILQHNGIPVSGSTISLSLDVYGRLQTYYGNRLNTDKITQEPVAKITKQDALEKYAKQYKVELQYKRTGGYAFNNSYVEPKLTLVYALVPTEEKNSYEALNAVTGQWTTIYSNPVKKGSEASDIKGHAAEQQLTELLKYGVFEADENGKLNPDQEITAGDLISYLAKATQPYYTNYNNGSERKAVAGTSVDSPYYDAVSFAVQSGWISKDTAFQADKKLTREQLAVLLTSFVKYSKISAYLDKDATVEQFSDASAIVNKGAVAITVKLGLLKDEGGKFNPGQNVTKAQVATIIMKLVELQGKTDQAIGSGSRY